MDQLNKAYALSKVQGLTTGLSGRMPVVPIFAPTYAPRVQISAVVISPMVVLNITSCITPEVEQLSIVVVSFHVHEPSLSQSTIKRSRSDSLSNLFEESFSKQTCLSEGSEKDFLTPFFWLLYILSSHIPSTPAEFTVVMANEELAFFRPYMRLTGGVFSHMLPIPYLDLDPLS